MSPKRSSSCCNMATAWASSRGVQRDRDESALRRDAIELLARLPSIVRPMTSDGGDRCLLSASGKCVDLLGRFD